MPTRKKHFRGPRALGVNVERLLSTRQSRDFSKTGENAIGMTYLLLTWV
jgi:hypothetical protein